MMTMTATITGIDVGNGQTPAITNDNLTAAHIHAGDLTPTGTRPVVWGFFGSPDNDGPPNGVDQLVFTPAASGAGGTFTSIWDALEGNGIGVNLANQIPFILAGNSYINFHTTQFGGGEIRGTLFVVPEPGTMALLGLGLFGLIGVRRKSA
jgi:hypothetical protein